MKLDNDGIEGNNKNSSNILILENYFGKLCNVWGLSGSN